MYSFINVEGVRLLKNIVHISTSVCIMFKLELASFLCYTQNIIVQMPFCAANLKVQFFLATWNFEPFDSPTHPQPLEITMMILFLCLVFYNSSFK